MGQFGLLWGLTYLYNIGIMLGSLLSAGFYGAGVGLALLYANQQLPYQAYIINAPLWMTVVVPIGITWKKKFLNKINEDQFPPQMKSYKQLFLSSRKAVVYDLILNQTIYHSGLGMLLVLINFEARKLYDRETEAKSLGQFLRDFGLGFIKLRVFFTCFSYLTEFWGAKLLLEKKGEIYTMIPHSRRLLLIKESLVQLAWMGSVMNLLHNQYPVTPKPQ